MEPSDRGPESKAVMAEVMFDRAKLNLLKLAYESAVKCGQEVFIFQGSELYVPFAKYMIEYLEDKLR